MSELRDLIIDAHGGMARWKDVKTISGDMSITGLLWTRKGWPDILKDVSVTAETGRQWISYSRFTEHDRRSIFQPHDVKIESVDGKVLKERRDPRAAFKDHKPETPWDDLHLAYFSGYAMWNYLNAPFMFQRPDIKTEEIEPWDEDGEKWRRLRVTFPESFATHCPVQIFHANKDGLLTRMDYEAEVTSAIPTAHYMSDYKNFDGIIVPTKRRALRRGADRKAIAGPAGVAIDIADIRLS